MAGFGVRAWGLRFSGVYHRLWGNQVTQKKELTLNMQKKAKRLIPEASPPLTSKTEVSSSLTALIKHLQKPVELLQNPIKRPFREHSEPQSKEQLRLLSQVL